MQIPKSISLVSEVFIDFEEFISFDVCLKFEFLVKYFQTYKLRCGLHSSILGKSVNAMRTEK